MDSWNWVTYKSEKEYLRFENKRDPGAEKYGSGKLLHESQAQVEI